MGYTFIISGAAAALLLFFYLLKDFDMKLIRTSIYGVSLVFALIISGIILSLYSLYLSNVLNSTYIISYSFYLTMVLFILFSARLSAVFHINTLNTGKLIAAPLMTFLALSKTGCYFNDCCFAVIGDKEIPLNLIESGLSLTALILIMTNIIKPDILILVIYSLFRLVTDFYKTNHRYETINNLTLMQIIYITVIAISVFIMIKTKFKENKAL